MYTKKAFDNTQNPFILKNLSKLGKEGILHNFSKGICINSTVKGQSTENLVLEFGRMSRKLTNTKTTD